MLQEMLATNDTRRETNKIQDSKQESKQVRKKESKP